MKLNSKYKIFLVILFSVLLSACGSYLKDDKAEEAPDDGFSQQIKPEPSTSAAVMSLIKQARTDAINGNIDKAMLRLERAVRIEPSNATVWHYMAKLY